MTGSEASYRDRRVLVLGASGFVGRWVARALAASGAQLQLVARDEVAAGAVADAYAFSGDVHVADLREPEQAARLVKKLIPDVVFNLAGYGVDPSERDPDLAQRINAQLPEALATELVAQRRDAKDGRPVLVHVGSALEYGDIAGDLAERSLPRPTTLYGETKLAGTLAVQRICSAQRVPALTARLFTVFGPGEHAGRLFPTLCDAASTNGTIPLTVGTQQRDFCFVEDVATGLLRLGAAHVEPGEVVNFACGEMTSVREFVVLAARSLGIAPKRLDFGALPTREEEMSHDAISVQRLLELVGWKPSVNLANAFERSHLFSSSLV
ncbi:MAG: NAD-dependent epimerase/dehydratase family protein [Myxococcota bacterium]|nr:NAD-dependent epimerase/dehydratase family protein [Myxococcota bacterium]